MSVDGMSATYRELDERMQLLAGPLADRGMDADGIVSVVLTGLVPTIVAAEGGIGAVLDRIRRDAAELSPDGPDASAPTLVSLFDDQVSRTPDSVALTFDGESLTYSEFDARVNRLARRLMAEGVGAESLVALAMRRSFDLLIGMYAVIKAGGGYVPVDPDQPADRINHILEVAAPVCVLTTSRDGFTAEGLVLDIDTLDLSGLPGTPVTDEDRCRRIDPSGIAYVIFTSGSTGKPKGVGIAHSAIVNRLLWMQAEYRLGPDDVVLQKTPATFDVSVWELFWPLQTGARMVIAKPDGHRDPLYLSRVILAESVTTAHFVPSMLAVFAAEPTVHTCVALRQIFASGEALPPQTAEAVRKVLPQARLHNLYGPTEAAVDVTYHEVTEADSVTVPIGAAVWNTGLHVLDQRLHQVPIGVAGELYLAGVQLARGYVGRAELTAERFVANPFEPSGERMYRTGDLVRRAPNGELEYIGRNDFQVKLRGLRIELGEIETAMLAHPAVSQAVVLVWDGADAEQHLVAYLVGTAGVAPDVESISESLRLSLPEYMIPEAMVVLDELPVTAHGKLDRRALPEPSLDTHRAEYREPSTPAEVTVAAVFAEILGAERVGADDSFFDLGGNSLSAARVVARVNAALGSDVSLREVFDAPTVAGLAQLAAGSAGTGRARPELVAAVRPERLPLSLAQSRMWFINQFDTASPAYNLPLGIRLTGALDTQALAAAVTSVLERHESLRTVFPDDGQGPHQVVLPVDRLDLDLNPVRVRDEAELVSHLGGLATQGFDVTVEIPVRPTLFELSATEHVLLFLVHHIAADGASMAPLARDVVAAYAAFAQGGSPDRAPLEVQYADFAIWQRELLGEEDDPDSLLARQVGYWVNELDGIPDLLTLPTDRPRPAVQSMRGDRFGFEIDAGLHERLRALAQQHEATLFTATHAAFALLLAKLSGTDDIVVGTPVAGRGEAALDDLVGMFVNTLALRTVVDPAVSFAELLAATRESDLGALVHADVPFERLVEILAPERSTAHSPIFQVVMSLENNEPAVVELPGLTVSPVDSGVTFAKFDLQLVLGEKPDGPGMTGEFVFATDLFDVETVRTMSERFVRLLDALTADPTAPVGDLEIVGATERAALAPVAGPAGEEPVALPDLLAAAAADRDAIALMFGDVALTYGELDDRSNALARVLIDQGVGPESFVALALSRSIESQVALWAVAKSGAAFVPMDPAYPIDRLEHMVKDSGALLGLTVADNVAGLPAATWLVLDDPAFAGEWAGRSVEAVTDADRVAPVDVAQAAYVIYTSGSTGMPKGVVVPHAGLANFAVEERARYGVSPGDRVLHSSSPSFDASILELLMAVGAGATLVIVPPTVYGGSELAEIIVGAGVTHAFMTPSAAAALPVTGLDPLRVLVLGGEAMTADLVARWASRVRLYNAYGPTEATVMVASGDPIAPGDAITIGGPIRGVDALVLDARLRPVPVGVAGELYVAGTQVARGYHARAALTADRFVADPFGPAGKRMYRTGDVVRWVDRSAAGDLSDLVIEYVGRSDFQVKVRGFRIELGEIDAALSAHGSLDFATTIGRTGPSGATVLVSYVMGAGDVNADALKEFVGRSLPAHMVPSAIVVLDEIPMTVGGKLDRKALPEPDFGSSAESYVAPANAMEELLAGLFAEVLGVARVSVVDSFFALGGDSIVSIQLVARAKAAGVVIKARDVFERKTVAGLAEVATMAADGAGPVVLEELPGGGVGEMPLLPVARWAHERGAASRFSQAVLLTAPKGIDRAALAGTVQAVLDQHDMLRAELVSGTDLLRTGAAGTVVADPLITRVEFDGESLPGTPGFERLAAASLDAAADRLDPVAGVMVQVVWFDPAPGAGEINGRILVVLHHLVVDGVSWRLLVPAFAAAWGQLGAGVEPTAEPAATSARRWAHALAEEALTDRRIAELGHWRAVTAEIEAPLGARPLDPAVDTMDTVESITAELPADTTEALLTAVPAKFRGGAQDGLLAALALAVAQWRRARGQEGTSAGITLEGHGREEQVIPGADLSRTVGWFTSVYPVRLDLAGVDLDDAFAAGPGAGAAVKAVKEQLLAVPDNGIGYGLLRYLNPTTAPELGSAAEPQITFNYLGRFGTDEMSDEIRSLGWIPVTDGGSLGGATDPAMAAASALDVNASVLAGGGLSMTLSYPRGVLTRGEVSELAELWREALTTIARHARSEESGGLTPSDVPLVDLTQAQIDGFERRYRGLEDIWSLSPLQHGLLFHALLAEGVPGVLDVYTAQFSLNFAGTFDAGRLGRAADRLLVRYPNLRAGFVVDEASGSLQVVTAPSAVPVTVHEVGALDESARDVERRRILDADQAAGFDMAAPPLLRLTVLRAGDESWQLLVTNHHVILDGWSTPLVIRELLTLYALDGDDSPLPRPRSYRDYLDWLSRQDRDESLRVWGEALAGIDGPTLLAPEVAGAAHAAAPGKVELALSAEQTARAQVLAGELGVTLNTLVQSAWALVLGMLSGRGTVVFGATVSGRPAALAGIEEMAGLFINTIPVAVRLDPAESVRGLLTRVQAEQADLLDHHYMGLTDIHKVAGDAAQFDTAVIFESYPLDTSGVGGDIDIAGSRLLGVDSTAASHFPLSVIAATSADRLHVAVEFQHEAFDEATATAHLNRLLDLLDRMVTAPDAELAQVPLVSDAERALLDSYNRTELARTSETLLERIDARVAQDPGAPAVVEGGVTVSRGELDRRANLLAHELIALGVGIDDVVALVLPRSVDWVVGMLAAWKVGAAYLPVDTKAPSDRIAAILGDCDVAAVVTARAWTDEIGYTGPVVRLDDPATRARVSERSESAPPNRWTEPGAGDRLAYVITTSGSTGRPKPTLVPMAGVLNTAEWYRGEILLAPGDGALVANSPVFDQTQKNVWVTLSDGGVLHLAADPFDPVEILEIIGGGSVVNANMAPSAFATLLDADTDQSVLPRLRSLHLGGESFNPARLAHLEAAGTRLHNNYGPTEATDMITDHRLRSVLTGYPDGRVPIGPALPNYELYVLDQHLRLVPPGVAGELYIGGVGVSRGY
ncbi:amino acid adenylation domain-containing protein, partial [Rhodococcus daqingensis]